MEVLLEQSQEVDLLMAGSRGYGPLGAVLLGGTTRQLTQAAACPLIVIPRDRSLDLGGGCLAAVTASAVAANRR